jgi:hypothetical protein
MTTNIDVTVFDPILPAPTRDVFVFDFTDAITKNPNPSGPANPVIDTVTWVCTLATYSQVVDPTPGARLVAAPTFSDFKTSCLAGDMIDGADYLFTATATITDGRILSKLGSVICLAEPRPPVPAGPPGSVPFDNDAFISSYPEFEGVSPEVIHAQWNQAGVLFRNDPSSPEQDLVTRGALLNMLTAHLLASFGGPGGGAGLVGRINSKSVNGVSVSAEGFGVTGTQGWYLTTKYGALFWRATAAYRTFRYIPGPQRFPSGNGWTNGIPGIGRIFPWS